MHVRQSHKMIGRRWCWAGFVERSGVGKRLWGKESSKTSMPVNLTGIYPHMPIAITGSFVTLTFSVSRSSKVKSMWSNIVVRALLDKFHVNKYDLDFWALKVIQCQIWWCQQKAHGSYIIRGSNFASVTVFEIFRVTDFDTELWPLRVIQGQIWWCQLGGGLQQAPLRHPARFQPNHTNGLWDVHYQIFSPFDLGQLTPRPKFTKGEMTCCPARSTSLPNFITLCQPTLEISLIKYPANKHSNTHTNKQ